MEILAIVLACLACVGAGIFIASLMQRREHHAIREDVKKRVEASGIIHLEKERARTDKDALGKMRENFGGEEPK